MAELTNNNTITVEIAGQNQHDIEVGSPMEHSRITQITENGKHVVSEYDLAEVDVVHFLDYYWIMPYNYGVPKISLSDATTTFVLKFRLREIKNGQVIYDDGYTSLIYDDDQYKARLNGGPWLETLIRESDVSRIREVKLKGTTLQIGYYLLTLEDGGHQWSYDQQLYIGYSPDYENVGNIEVYNCKLYWDNGDFANYVPVVVNGAATLEDKISGDEMVIKDIEFESDADYWPSGGKDVLTNIVVNDENYRFECEWSWNTFNTRYNQIYGSYSSKSRTVFQTVQDWGYEIAFAYNTIVGTSVTRTGVRTILGKKYKSVLTSKGLDLDGTFYKLGNKVFDTEQTTPLYIGSNYNSAGDFNLYSLKIYHNDELVLDLVPQKIHYSYGDIYYLYDKVGKKNLNNSYRFKDLTTEISTFPLEASDVHTVTLSNEEYQALMPILSEMRGEEYVDNTPKPVVD